MKQVKILIFILVHLPLSFWGKQIKILTITCRSCWILQSHCMPLVLLCIMLYIHCPFSFLCLNKESTFPHDLPVMYSLCLEDCSPSLLVGSLSFKPQLICHFCREAFSNHWILSRYPCQIHTSCFFLLHFFFFYCTLSQFVNTYVYICFCFH